MNLPDAVGGEHSGCDEGRAESIAPEVTRRARAQTSECHTDMMNRFLLSATDKRYKSVRGIIVEGLCDFLSDSDRGKRAVA